MGDYEPVDLVSLCNAGLDAIDNASAPVVGEQTFHGLPFLIGSPHDSGDRCFILLEPSASPITVPVGRTADRVIVAHRRLRQGGPEDDPAVGTVVADYIFHLENGSREQVEIRDRLEIAASADDEWDASGPFHATGSNTLVRLNQFEGPWHGVGTRQCEVFRERLHDYLLWVWENPTREVPVGSIELVAREGSVLVAAITTGNANEHPFPQEAARIVRITAVGPNGPQQLTNPSVEVDRGIASYAFRLPGTGAEALLEDPLQGWGEDVDPESPHTYARIAAVPSATVRVRDGDRELGQFRWGEFSQGRPIDRDGVRVEVIEEGRNWVHVTVVEDQTGRPVPCRVHFQSPEGVPYQPYGHHDHVNSDLGTWHIDVGGDVRLGRVTYAYIDGVCQGWLPRGDVIVDVVRGFEYEPIRERVRIDPGQRELVLTLKRWKSMNGHGWYSGDSHVHFLSSQGSLLEQQGEDLNVVNLLQSQWGSLFTNTEDFTGSLVSADDGRYLTWVSQENRQPFFGHMLLWGLHQPVMPWCTDGPNEAELGAWQETTLSDWADRCHKQGGTVVIPHFPEPNGEPAVLIATGRADAIEMIRQRPAVHKEYYRYLNAGYRIPLVGGTDKMTSEVPVGLYRTYAKLGDEEFTYEAWCRAVREGRTFLSGGPILHFDVDGHQSGDLVRLSGSGTVSVSAVAEGIFPIETLQVVLNGEVIAAEDASSAHRLELRTDVSVEADSWLAARCGGPRYWDGPSHRDVWARRIFAHTSPVYVACGRGEWSRFDHNQVRTMLALIEAGITRLRAGRRYPESRITHHHGEEDHQAFLERPFVEALERVRARLEGAGR